MSRVAIVTGVGMGIGGIGRGIAEALAREQVSLMLSDVDPRVAEVATALRELIEMARKQKLNYGSWGIGSHPHLFYSKLGSLTKTEFTMVPYKGVAPVIQALRAEEVPLSVMSVGTARPLIDAGRVKVLAAAAKQRTPEFPNVPTTGELGLQGLESSIFMVFLMPRATPTAIVDKASSAVQAIMRRPDFATPNVTSKGFQVIASDPKGVTAAVDELTPLVADSIKAANITPD